ncbi:hypothetical protein BDFG_05438 [Blastomyces dermatitidis ATCC 26199]|nr:hypothetical protein BDFG_05438 [Blastomyces dermatitidis ATCC 26199]
MLVQVRVRPVASKSQDARLPNPRQSDQSFPREELEMDDKASPYFLDPTHAYAAFILCWGSIPSLIRPRDQPIFTGTIHRSWEPEQTTERSDRNVCLVLYLSGSSEKEIN